MIYQTEGVKYVGSKLKILPIILDIIGNLDGVKTVLDGFSGSTRVSQALAHSGYGVVANDISDWSQCFGQCYLLSENEDSYYQQIIDHLNNQKGFDGWFTEHYGGLPDDTKLPFQAKNTRKLDAIREEIDRLGLAENDKSVIITSLILALDRVDSTLGHHTSYLKEWSARSHKDLMLTVPNRPTRSSDCRVVKGDIFDFIAQDQNQFDLAYFDPPYGSNNEKMPTSRVRYASYYHLWTTIVRNDRPEIFGKAGRREDSRDRVCGSVFEEFRKNPQGQYIAMSSLDRLIEQTQARYILLSYSSGGRANRSELDDIIARNGNLLKIIKIDHKKNIMSSMRWTSEWIHSDGDLCEYLFLMEK